MANETREQRLERLAEQSEQRMREEDERMTHEFRLAGAPKPGEEYDTDETEAHREARILAYRVEVGEITKEEAEAFLRGETVDQNEENNDQSQQQAPNQEEIDLNRKLKAKIAGEERDVSVAELLASYQKNQHADRQIYEASLLKKELELKEKELELLRKESVDKNTTGVRDLNGQDNNSFDQDLSSDDAYKEIVNLALAGEDEESANRLNKTISKELDRRLQAEATKIRDQVRNELKAASEEEMWKNAVIGAKNQNPEYFDDPDMATLWGDAVRNAASQNMGAAEAIEAANKRLEAFKAKMRPAGATFKTNDQDLKRIQEEKDKAGRFNVDAKNVQRVTSVRREKEESASDVIAEMKKSRTERVIPQTQFR